MNLHKKEKSVFLLEMLDDLIGQVVWKMYGCMDKNWNILYFQMNHTTLAIVMLYLGKIQKEKNQYIKFLYIKSMPGPVFTAFYIEGII